MNVPGVTKEVREGATATSQLKSPTPMEIPQRFATRPLAGAMPEFNPLTPWTFWMQAAEIWQRTWVPDMAHKDRSY